MNWSYYAFALPALLISLTVHEFAHAWSASKLGDDYARRLKRVSLNPFRHLTPLGTLAILLLPFGWGKPVPVNLYNFRRPRRDYLLTSLAGPGANLLLGAVCLGLLALTRHTYAHGPGMAKILLFLHVGLTLLVMMNAMLAVFNLIPVPPLDGSKIWPCVLGSQISAERKGSRIFMTVLIVLLCTGGLSPFFDKITDVVMAAIPKADAMRYDERMKAAADFREQEKWPEAEACLTEALAIHPTSPDALLWRASARLRRYKAAEALTDLDEAIRLIPDNADLYSVRAVARGMAGDTGAMAEDLAMCRKLRRAAASQSAATQP